MNALSKSVLVLNNRWQVIGEKSVPDAMVMLYSEVATAVSFDDGFPNPLKWSDWLKLPIRTSYSFPDSSEDLQDDYLGTMHGPVRVPRVIIAVNYGEFKKKRLRLTTKNLRKHYNDTCAYSGKKLTASTASKEHVIPRSRGGSTDWNNIALVDKTLNNKRGNKPLSEMGLKLRVRLSEPTPVSPIHLVYNRFGFPEWDYFITKAKNKC